MITVTQGCADETVTAPRAYSTGGLVASGAPGCSVVRDKVKIGRRTA